MLFWIGIEKSATLLRLYNWLHALLLIFHLVAFYHFVRACVWLNDFDKDRLTLKPSFWIIMLVLFVATLLVLTLVLGIIMTMKQLAAKRTQNVIDLIPTSW